MSADLISAVVLTKDEAAHVQPCLRTLRWADDVLVVDSGVSADAVASARAAGARVVIRPFDDWAHQRNFALDQAHRPWVLFVDVDERVPPALAEEITERVTQAEAAGSPAGFWIPRQNLILGRWVKHAGWSPDAQLRLFRRDSGRYDPDRLVHELVELQGASSALTSRLVHHNYTTRRQLWTKQLRYARTEALALHRQGIHAKRQNLVLQPLREFRRRYVTLQGYRDGPLGLELSLTLALANLVTYLELARLNRSR